MKTSVCAGRRGVEEVEVEGVERGEGQEEHEQAHAERDDEALRRVRPAMEQFPCREASVAAACCSRVPAAATAR